MPDQQQQQPPQQLPQQLPQHPTNPQLATEDLLCTWPPFKLSLIDNHNNNNNCPLSLDITQNAKLQRVASPSKTMELPSTSFLPEWTVSLFHNLGIYFVLFGLGYLAVKQVRKSPPACGDRSLYAKAARFFVFGPEGEDEASKTPTKAKATQRKVSEMSSGMQAMTMAFCSLGLLGSYLTWGVLQEQIMTTKYGVEEEKFESSNFLVSFRVSRVSPSKHIVQCR
jgi:hypothetical protein